MTVAFPAPFSAPKWSARHRQKDVRNSMWKDLCIYVDFAHDYYVDTSMIVEGGWQPSEWALGHRRHRNAAGIDSWDSEGLVAGPGGLSQRNTLDSMLSMSNGGDAGTIARSGNGKGPLAWTGQDPFTLAFDYVNNAGTNYTIGTCEDWQSGGWYFGSNGGTLRFGYSATGTSGAYTLNAMGTSVVGARLKVCLVHDPENGFFAYSSGDPAGTATAKMGRFSPLGSLLAAANDGVSSYFGPQWDEDIDMSCVAMWNRALPAHEALKLVTGYSAMSNQFAGNHGVPLPVFTPTAAGSFPYHAVRNQSMKTLITM